MDSAASSSNSSFESLRTMLRDVSRIQASQYFGGEEVVLSAPPDQHHVGQVLKRYMAIVLLTSNEMRIVFKVHFNPEQVRAYREARSRSNEPITDKQLIDFMKELSNQMGGRVCRVLDTHQVAMGMSVPLCTRGIYEIYADYEPRSGAIEKFGDLWQLNGPFDTLYCSCYVEVIGKRDFSNVSCSDEEEQDGELDFL